MSAGLVDIATILEKKAVKFYRELQQKTRFANQRKLLKDYELMEVEHVTVLENIRKNGIGDFKVKKTTNLKISDYFLDIEPSDTMSYGEILLMVAKKEDAAYNLYTELAKTYAGTDVELLFKKLAAEELDHKYMFESLYDDEVNKEN